MDHFLKLKAAKTLSDFKQKALSSERRIKEGYSIGISTDMKGHSRK